MSSSYLVTIYRAWEDRLVDVAMEFLLDADKFFVTTKTNKSSSHKKRKPMERETREIQKSYLPKFIHAELHAYAKSFLLSVSPDYLQQGTKERELYRTFLTNHGDTLRDIHRRWGEMQVNDAYEKDVHRMHNATSPHMGGRSAFFMDNIWRRSDYLHDQHPQTMKRGLQQNERLRKRQMDLTRDVRVRDHKRKQQMQTWLSPGDYMDTSTLRNTADPYMAQRQTFLTSRSIPFV